MSRFFILWVLTPSLFACAALLPSPECNDRSLRNEMTMTFKDKKACKWT